MYFRCSCTSGWHGFHCNSQSSACDQSNGNELCGNGVCVKSNTPLGYTCICQPVKNVSDFMINSYGWYAIPNAITYAIPRIMSLKRNRRLHFWWCSRPKNI